MGLVALVGLVVPWALVDLVGLVALGDVLIVLACLLALTAILKMAAIGRQYTPKKCIKI